MIRCLSVCLAAPLALACLAVPAAAQSAGEWGRFGIQTQYIDPAAKPGDDFDRHVNGKWNDTYQMPADKSRVGAFSQLGDLSEERLRAILDGLKLRKWPAGSPEARLASLQFDDRLLQSAS